MRIFKLSHGTKYFGSKELDYLSERKVVCVHPDSPSIGTTRVSQGELFVNAKRGDLFYVCISNNSVDFIGMFTDERPEWSKYGEKKDDWSTKDYVLIAKASNPTGYQKKFNKRWMPVNVSTFTEVPKHELTLFESNLLEPAFGISLKELQKRRDMELAKLEKGITDYKALQLHFNKLMNNETYLLEQVNALSEKELSKLKYEFDNRGDVKSQPVVLLRKRLLEKLIEGSQIDLDLIEKTKTDIEESFEKDVFKSWKLAFRILYPLLYSQHRIELIDFFKKFAEQIQTELGIEKQTKIAHFHFDGPQNQGDDKIWFVIYNKSYKSHRTAKQLLFVIKDVFEYGYRDGQDVVDKELVEPDKFDHQQMMDIFKKHKDDILNDDSKERAEIAELIDLVEFKGQLILQGPPGTGKTYRAKQMARIMVPESTSGRVKIIQFHPSYSYEDFVRGISAKTVKDKVVYKTEDRIFGEFIRNANDSDKPHVLIIDEINRANLPSVLGELIYALEYRDEALDSMYATEKGASLSIPKNLYIIGTMNTADRSVAHIDYAIRRRFAFASVLPKEHVIKSEKAKQLFKKVDELFKLGQDGIGEYLAGDFKPNDVRIGHSYFLLESESKDEQLKELQLKLKYEIVPILREYLKDGILLNSAEVQIDEIEKFPIGTN